MFIIFYMGSLSLHAHSMGRVGSSFLGQTPTKKYHIIQIYVYFENFILVCLIIYSSKRTAVIKTLVKLIIFEIYLLLF